MFFQQRYYYFIKLEYLGYAYHGWQKQPDVKTLEFVLQRTLKYVLDSDVIRFKILGAGRTDAKVSAVDAAMELFVDGAQIEDLLLFKEKFNANLPADIRVKEVKQTNANFNIIHDSKHKEYVYLFASGQKLHPYAAPFLFGFREKLDIKIMQEAASIFCGRHSFHAYTKRPKQKTDFYREISEIFIRKNVWLQANFFPEKSYALHVVGSGFMRYQIRMIMGALFEVGVGEKTLEDIRNSLDPSQESKTGFIAPPAGLHLKRLDF
ncbi:MAG: tRNA pseudouridine(38-40) synthase TruA [Flavobacteriaceae bacterium]|nr:tRNA pseudouridine(38-40) synthase TruA [Flavobacteriaceae bacterium]